MRVTDVSSTGAGRAPAMRRRLGMAVAATTMALMGLSACGSSTAAGPVTLDVWLMKGSAPDDIISAVNDQFTKEHPGDKVNVEIQQWSDVTTKLDTAYAGKNVPDVVELGNTLVAKYAANGALKDVTSDKGSFENSSTWLQSLTDSCTYQGKLYCIPYYAGTRAVIYRKDWFDANGLKPPTSFDELMTTGKTLMDKNKSDANYSALYFPGKYWYAALPLVWDQGGDIASNSGGKWTGTLESASSEKGLQNVKTMVSALSKADTKGDELKQDDAFAKNGNIAMIIANGWEVGVITGANADLKGKLGVFPFPSTTAGKTAPVFLGGSDLAVSAKSPNAALAEDWIKLLAGTKYQTQMATEGKVIPNTTTLLSLNDSDPLIGTFAHAAQVSKFVPNSPNWANVETKATLQNMLSNILSGSQPVDAAAKAADAEITSTLNGS